MEATKTVERVTTPTGNSVAVGASISEELEWGNGRYSVLMKEAYKDAKRLFGMPSAKAEKFARQLGSDLGKVNFQVTMTYGKYNKDNKLNLKDVATAKLVTGTYSIAIAKCIAALNEANKLGVYQMGPRGAELVHDEIREWLA